MLELLHIENIAVIESADICFQAGFNALTGETGAGKSIVIDAMGAVFLMLLATVVLSLVLGILSRHAVKWAYPAACAVVFLPTVPIYYNSSALVHALWYLVVAAVGLAVGSGLGALVRKAKK